MPATPLMPARPRSLAGRLARAERTAALTFAGQGSPVLDELDHLRRQSPALRHLLGEIEGRLHHWFGQKELRWSGLYPAPPAITRWLDDPGSRPAAGFLQSTQLTNPLIFATQMLRYQALYEEGLGEALAGIPVIAGHSQGLMPSLLVAESPGGAVPTQRVLDYLDYMVWQGLCMARCYHDPAAGAPMAAVSGPSLEVLAGFIDALNAELPEAQPLTLTLENTRTRGVVSGRPDHLRRLRNLLDARGSEQVTLRKSGKFGGKPMTFTWEDLAVGGPFHSPYMGPGLVAMREAVTSLGFRVEAAHLNQAVLCTDDARDLRREPDLTEALMVAQFVRPVRWRTIVQKLASFPGLDLVLDLGPGDGVARLTSAVLRGAGVAVLPLSPAGGASERVLLAEGQPDVPKPICYADFAPRLVRTPDGTLRAENRFTRATGQPPVILPGMTPTTADVPIVAAAANAGFSAELAGGGQVSEDIFWRRMAELAGALEPGREIIFNALYLDPYLWDLHVRRAGLVLKARRAGFPIAGLTISAGIPETDEAVKLLGQLRETGLTLNAFKPGTLPQIEQVVRIAAAAPDHTIFLHLEGGRAGGHHSWEDLEQLLLDGYASIRGRPNLVLCVGGGIGDPARANELLTGAWSARHGLGPMPVDAVLLGTVTMAVKEAATSPAVKAALVAAAGHPGWVLSGEQRGGVTSGKSQLDADIHYLDNAAAACGRLLDQVAGDEGKVAARRDEIIAALNRTAKPYFGDLLSMTWGEVLRRAVALMAIGRGGPYEDGPWPDLSFRDRIVDLLARAEARLIAQDRGAFSSALGPDGGRAALDQPEAALLAFFTAYPHAETTRLTHSDARHFVRQICARPGKPVNFVPVLDADVRRWYKADSLWQSHDARYPADAVLVIPGPEALAGLDRVDEPVASLLDRFETALVRHLEGQQQPESVTRLRRGEHTVGWPVGVSEGPSAEGWKLDIRGEVPAAEWRAALIANAPVALSPIFEPRWFCTGRSIANPLFDLLRPEAGASLTMDRRQLVYTPAGRPDESLSVSATVHGWLLSVRAGARFELPLSRIIGVRGGDPAVALVSDAHLQAVRSYYLGALFGRDLPASPLFHEATAEVGLPPEQSAAYAAVVGAGAHAPLELAFSLLWRPLFEVLAAAELAGGLLRLVHLENRVEAGPAWPPAPGQRLTARARVTRVEEGEGGRVVEVRGSLSDGDRLAAHVESRFYIKRSPVDGELPELRACEPFTAKLRPSAVELGFLSAPWLVLDDGVVLVPGQELEIDTWICEERPRGGPTHVRAQGTLCRDGAVIGRIGLDERRDRRGHPVRDLIEAVGPHRGPRVHDTPRRRLGETTIQAPAELVTFAEVGGDHNPIHQRLLAARLAGLPGPIVHGMWTSARLTAFGLAAANAHPRRGRESSATFLEPVLPGEELHLDAVRVGRIAGDELVEATASVLRADDWRPAARVRARVAPPRTAIVFPGQGVQKQGMGLELMGRSPAARAVWEAADAHARAKLGFSIIGLVRDNPREAIIRGERLMHPEGLLHLTAFTQVALAVLASAQVAELREVGLLPPELTDGLVTAGHSLGEYNALSALAGVVSLEAVVEVVYARGAAMHRLVPRDARGESGYRMGVLRPAAAGLSHEAAESLIDEVGQKTGAFLQIVNYNVRGRQYAVVGDAPVLERLEKLLNRGGVRGFVPVPGIDVPFHSRVLASGVPEFRAVLQRELVQTRDYTPLVGRYIPNLVPRLFSLDRGFAEALAAVGAVGVLERQAEHAAGQIDDSAYARELLIELLAWQFASPVQWIATTELMFQDVAQGGLGVERLIEVGPGHQPTLANMARQSLLVWGDGAPPVAVFNAEADRGVLLGLDGEDAKPKARIRPSVSTPTTSPAPSAAAPAAVAVVSRGSSGPPPEINVPVAEALKALLALQAKVRPEQIRDDETIDQLFDGVSSRRNQVLMDLGAEFQAGSVDGAHERPIAVLAAELARRAPGWKLPGPYLRAAGDEALRRLLGRAGWGRKELCESLSGRFAFGAGLNEAAVLALTLGAREGDSGRGGRLGDGLEAPADRAGAAALAERIASLLGGRHGFSLPSAEGEAGGGLVDPAALRALEERLLGPEGPLHRAAEALAAGVGQTLVSAQHPAVWGLPEADAAAAKLALYEAEHGEGYAELIAPAFDAARHVAFLSAWASARRDVAALAMALRDGAHADPHEQSRLAAFAAVDPRVADTARWYRARTPGAGPLETIAAGQVGAGLRFQPSRPRVEITAAGPRAHEEPWTGPDAGQRWIDGLWPDAVSVPGHDTSLRDVLRASGTAPLPFAGRTALVTGASPGSIALALVRHLLRGGARVVLTTSTYSASRLLFYRRLYQAEAGPGAELHVVPFNQASLQDCDNLLDWMLRPVVETSGATTKTLKGPWTPDLIVPFAALRDLGMLPAFEGRSQAALRALLFGVERLVAGLGARLLRQGAPARPSHVLLPLSPNHGVFGGDGTYAEGKAGLEALLHKVRSEAGAWGRAISLTGARIGWVRGTGLMDAHDAAAARLEEMGLRTFSTEEMALLLAGLCVDPLRAAAESAPLSAELTGGFERLPDVGATVGRARESILADVAAAKRRAALSSRVQPPIEPVARHALPTPSAAPRPAPSWPNHGTPLHRMVVVVGAGELGPWGSARTRHEIEVDGRLSAAGILELAWMTGLVRFQEDSRGGSWVDGKSGEPVAEHEIAVRYEEAVLTRAGIRVVDPASAGFDPQDLPVMAPLYLERELSFAVANAEEAQSFLDEDRDNTRILRDPASGELRVVKAAGSIVRVPRRFRLKRAVAGLLPDGYDPVRWGIPKDMVDRIDRIALVNLVATVEAFLSAGLSPEALMARLHPARVANTQGGGIGGMVSLRKLFTDLLMGVERQSDALQETLINVVAAHVVQSYVGSYGAMAHPVGACASAAVSLEEAQDKILSGRADFVVAGGFDDVGPAGAIGFQDMAATADSDDAAAVGIEPRALSRPCDRRRRGFVEAQGGGTVLLARGDVAARLGLPVLGVLAYGGTFGDGLHRSIPAPGLGLVAAAQGGVSSPLGSALASFGLTADDIGVVYKHDTSTNANDLNESRIHHAIQVALGRTPGNPLWVVSQKSITGHAKGGSAAWQTVGLLQTLVEGRVGGNPNLESVDEALRPFYHLGFSDRTLDLGPLRAGLLTSLGFGHVNAIALLLHPDAFVSALDAETAVSWREAVERRTREAALDGEAAMMGIAPAYRRRPDRRLAQADGTNHQAEEEIAMLLDPDARLVDGVYRLGSA